MDDLLQEFIAETRETLDALSGEIVAWESDPSDRTRLDSIFRFVHTVKGSCGFLDLPRLARLSNAAEDVLSAVRDGERTADTALVDAVLAIIDRIGEIVEAIDAGASLDDSSEDLLIAALDENAAAIAATVATAPTIQRAPSRSVRLSVDLLDRMMGGMSDMVLARNDLARRLRDDNGDPAVMIALARLSTTVADMRDTVTRTRMQRIDALFSALPRLVRDTAASVGKSVTLVVDGGDVELDREMIEMLRDPLAHMVRNAIDHGIEPPALRRASGKPQTGRLTVAARQSGNRIVVEIFDDGGGINTDRLVAKALAHDPRRTAELAVMDAAARLDLIFEPGLSTRDQVTAVSGRGVGMDVVRANVEQIGGRIALNNRPGQGLEVTLEVPLTLAILPAVVVVAGGQDFAIPRRAIEEIVATRGEAIRIDALGAARIATIRGQRMPLVSLGAILGLGDPGNESDAAPPMLVILEVPGGHYALAVDAVLDTEELVVRPAAPAVMAAGMYAGQTLPDSGLPLLMIDCAGVASAAGVAFDRARAAEPDIAAIADPGIAALLFQDLDGHRRAIALAAIDRIDQVRATAIARTGGRLRMVTDNTTVALVATGEVPVTGDVGVLKLHDGAREIGYVIAAAIDIVTLTAPIVAAEGGGAISGVTVLDGQPVEMLDPLWLLDRSVPPLVAAKPVCLVQGGDAGWMTIFLGPALTAAGYRVVTDLAPGEAADVVLAMEGESVTGPQPGSVVTLSRDRDGGIYCYDRAALVAAVSARISGDRT